MKAVKPTADVDLLYGLAAIGSHIGLTARQAEHLIAKGEIPTFKMGRTVCARQSELEAHFARASTARRGSPPPAVGAGKVPTQAGALLYGHRAIASHLGIPISDVKGRSYRPCLPHSADQRTFSSPEAWPPWRSRFLVSPSIPRTPAPSRCPFPIGK